MVPMTGATVPPFGMVMLLKPRVTTRIGLTLHMRPFRIFLRASMTSTLGSMLGGSPVMMHLASCSAMARLSYVNWFTCHAIGHWRD